MARRLLDERALQQRETTILDAASEVIQRVGVAGLTIDKVVAKVPYSKGTVYSHFSCKEDMVTALCNDCVRNLCGLFERAITYPGDTRKQMLAVSYAYLLSVQLRPDRYLLVITAKSTAFKEKASTQRQAENKELEGRLMTMFCSVISHALDGGELVSELEPREVAFSIWSMTFGTIVLLIEEGNAPSQCAFRADMMLEHQVMTNVNMVLDGLGWQPTTPASELSQLVQMFKQGLFQQEAQQLAEKAQF